MLTDVNKRASNSTGVRIYLKKVKWNTKLFTLGLTLTAQLWGALRGDRKFRGLVLKFMLSNGKCCWWHLTFSVELVTPNMSCILQPSEYLAWLPFLEMSKYNIRPFLIYISVTIARMYNIQINHDLLLTNKIHGHWCY